MLNSFHYLRRETQCLRLIIIFEKEVKDIPL